MTYPTITAEIPDDKHATVTDGTYTVICWYDEQGEVEPGWCTECIDSDGCCVDSHQDPGETQEETIEWAERWLRERAS